MTAAGWPPQLRHWAQALCSLLAVGLLARVGRAEPGSDLLSLASRPELTRSIGILGDSDSHSYHDGVLLADPELRGGPYRETTLQWIEIWHRLRPAEIDPGAWGTWGTPGRIGAFLRLVGRHARAPRKEDFEFNLAYSGARCSTLNEGLARQVEPLLELMHREPEQWSNGVVIIRIGVNDFGQPEALDRFATYGNDAVERTPVMECLGHIDRAVRAIRARHPTTKIVLVGIFNNAHWAKTQDRWHDVDQLNNISRALDVFDDGLRTMAASDHNIAFHDDRAWWESRWGGRSSVDGTPAYRPFSLNGGEAVITNTVGDHPNNVVVADGHFGTAGNAIWLQSLVDLVETTWSLGLTRITLREVLEVTDPSGEFGLLN